MASLPGTVIAMTEFDGAAPDALIFQQAATPFEDEQSDV
jgi:hypothetical protein